MVAKVSNVAKVTKDQIKGEFDTFAMIWDFLKGHYVPETQEDWEQVVDDADKLAPASPCPELAAELVIAVVNHLERLSRQKRH